MVISGIAAIVPVALSSKSKIVAWDVFVVFVLMLAGWWFVLAQYA